MNESFRAALTCATRGLSVIPIQPREKKPLVHWEQYQSGRATESEIKAWWGKWPDANIGIVTGAISGVVVIDLDTADVKDKLKELLPTFDLTKVPRSRTGKGWQLFFKHPGVAVSNRAGVIPGLDVRGDGGFVVAPPSIHPKGKVYKWEVPINGELPELPPELLKMISSPASSAGNGYREKFNTAQALAGVPEGQRDEILFKLACKLRSADIPREMADALILEGARNCEPPFSERIALEKLARAYRRYEPKNDDNKESKKERIPITIRVSDVQRENVSWLWQDRVPIGKLTIIEGNPGLGKSWLTLAIATAVSTGSALPGDVAREAANVILMSAEDGLADTIRPRLEDMGAALDRVIALRGMVNEKGQEQAISLADLDVLEEVIIGAKPRLVIVDPIIAFTAGKDTHKANEVRSLLAPLAALAEKHDCAIVAVRHLNKSTAQALYRGQGSIDFVATCRSAFVVGENPDDAEERVLCHLKSNLAPKTSSLVFGIDQGRFGWKGESSLTAEQVLAVPADIGERSKLDEAKVFLEDVLSNGPIAYTEVEKAAKGAVIALATLKRARAALGIKPTKASFGGGWLWSLPVRRSSSNIEEAHVKSMSAFGENELLRDNETGWEDLR